MKFEHPLKQILKWTERYWNHPRMRDVVRDVSQKALLCGTLALGAEVYASEAGEKIFCHICEGRGCSRCGNRATEAWQREQEVLLPDIRYRGITLTMPDVFWPIFKENPRLQHDLPALGAKAIENLIWKKHQAWLFIVVVLQTFGGALNYHPHLHMLVSAGGLQILQSQWVDSLEFDQEQIRDCWRGNISSYLWKAIHRGAMEHLTTAIELEELIFSKIRDPWNVHVTNDMSKKSYLGYAGRYIRRPPVAQNRILDATPNRVLFLAKDTMRGEMYEVRWSLTKFVDTWAEHILDRYEHSMRYFGLLAPRTKNQTSAAVFAMLGQTQRPKPGWECFADLQERTFGVNPLIDEFGDRMTLSGRIPPERS